MPPLPRKKTVALDLLERASVFVHLDPRRPGVIVPQGFLKQHQLVLQIGLNMAISIPDLDVTDEGITCTLSFNKRPHFCSLPWGAIYALIGEQGGGMVWPEDVPPEVVSQQQQSAVKKEVPRQQKSNLRAVGDSADRSSKGVRRASTPPRLVQVVPPQPKPELASTRSDPGRQESARSESARPESPRVEPSVKPDATPRPQETAGTKRSRPPYLRLVE